MPPLPACSRLIVPPTIVVLLLVLLAGAQTGCRDGAALPRTTGEIEVRLAELVLDPDTHSPVVVLEEKRGGRKLPIWIGTSEALSIAAARDRQRPPRPNTHDLAKRLVDRLGAAVDRVVVTRLTDGVYYALIRVRGSEGSLEVDARPSDAIAIALRYQAPLFVDERLLIDSTPTTDVPPTLPDGHPPIVESEEAQQRI